MLIVGLYHFILLLTGQCVTKFQIITQFYQKDDKIGWSLIFQNFRRGPLCKRGSETLAYSVAELTVAIQLGQHTIVRRVRPVLVVPLRTITSIVHISPATSAAAPGVSTVSAVVSAASAPASESVLVPVPAPESCAMKSALTHGN